MTKHIILLSSLALLLTGCSHKAAITVDTYKYEKQELSESFTIKGTVQPADSYAEAVTELTDCKVTDIYVRTGSYVKKGDKICSFDVSGIDEEIQELEKKLDSSSAQNRLELKQYEDALAYERENMELELKKAQNKINAAQDQYNAMTDKKSSAEAAKNYAEEKAADIMALISSGDDETVIEELYEAYNTLSEQIDGLSEAIEEYSQGISETQSELDSYRLEYESTKRECEHEIAVAKAELESFKSSYPGSDEEKLKKLRAKREGAELCAPADGMISRLGIERGGYCMDGIAAEILTSDEMEIVISVPDEYILHISKDDDVKFTSSGDSEKEYSGRVTEVGRLRGENGYDTYISVDNAGGLYSGMTASVTFTTDVNFSYAVPKNAISYGELGETLVYTLEPGSDGSYTVKGNTVTVGINCGRYIEITSGDIAEGALVVTTPERCADGMKVMLSGQEEQQ